MSRQGMLSGLGVRGRVLFLAVVPVVFVALLLGYTLVTSRLDDARRDLEERGQVIARNLALASEFALFSRNLDLLGDLLERTTAERAVTWAAIWDDQQQVLISRGHTKLEAEQTVVTLAQGKRPSATFFHADIGGALTPVTDFSEEFQDLEPATGGHGQRLLGWAMVELAPAPVLKREATIIRSSLLITLAGLILTLVLGVAIGNGITEPLSRLIDTVRRLRAGDLSARVKVLSGGEIGSLEDGVNQMAASLEQVQQTLQDRVESATTALRDTVAELEGKNAELEAARQAALKAGQERTEFLARMSHEIRTPLNAVVGFTKLLQNRGAGRDNAEHIRTIQGAADQLLHVINDILQFIRLDAGADELEVIPFKLGDTLEDTVAMLSPMANAKGLELVLLLHSDLPETLWGDPSRIAQVVVNLVNNAIKFTEHGHVVVETSCIEPAHGKPGVMISVSDTGVGLSAQHQVRIFEAFAQADSSVTRRYGGTGLGLSIARRLVNLMGGEMGVDSHPGAGARFWFRLPCHDHSPPVPIRSDNPLSGHKVLIYDANPWVRRSLRNVLFGWAMDVFQIGQADQIGTKLQAAATHDAPFSLLVLGLTPAEREDKALLPLIAGLRECYPGPILLLTASETWRPPPALARQNAIVWAGKPIRRVALQRVLHLLLGVQGADAASTQRHAKPSLLQGIRVLAAEDNPFNRELLRYLLLERGAMVDEVVDGEEAVTAALSKRYDLILMDVHMPRLDGLEAARRIRAELGTDTPPIVALTADVFRRSAHTDTASPFDDWVLKPIDPERIAELLSLWSHRPSAAASAMQRPATEAAPPGSQDVAAAAPPQQLPAALVRRYRDELERLHLDASTALAKHDLARLATVAHDLKGMTGTFADQVLVRLARDLETQARAGDTRQCTSTLQHLRERIPPPEPD